MGVKGMKQVLSIQSHVAFGYAGNRAATFPLQRLGLEVSVINTVQFSNHTGYGDFKGQILPADHILEVYSGIEAITSQPFDGILTGYLGSEETGDAVLNIVASARKRNPNLIYCCDPVMGDIDRGFFVKDKVPQFFKHKAMKAADILTPNHFEMEFLIGRKIKTEEDVKTALTELSSFSGANYILITSLILEDQPNEVIAVMLLGNKNFHKIEIPTIPFQIQPNGCGDMFAALFLGHILKGRTSEAALDLTTKAVSQVLQSTYKKDRREIDIIGAQEAFQIPKEASNKK